jgi:hypothetical protein
MTAGQHRLAEAIESVLHHTKLGIGLAAGLAGAGYSDAREYGWRASMPGIGAK